MSFRSIYADLPSRAPNEIVETLASSISVRVERIVSYGHSSPPGFWYNQDQDEWVLVVQGAARLSFAGQETAVELKAGDYLHIPAHHKHRVEWTTPDEPTIWLAIHYGP
jgi:cupin 2 domain-containing protein